MCSQTSLQLSWFWSLTEGTFHTYRHTDITTYRKNRPRGQFFGKLMTEKNYLIQGIFCIQVTHFILFYYFKRKLPLSLTLNCRKCNIRQYKSCNFNIIFLNVLFKRRIMSKGQIPSSSSLGVSMFQSFYEEYDSFTKSIYQ